MDSLEQHREAHREAAAALAMAGRLRIAFAKRDELVRPFRERYERSCDDPRIPFQKRLEIAEAFTRAAYRADHLYEDYLEGAAEAYREMLVGGKAQRIGAVA
jgi:hypothetical protein